MQDPNLALFHTALKNAEQFITDAQLLLDNGSVGHAYGLSVLSFEEFGKALLGFNCYLGVFTREDKTFKDMFKDHSEKQMTAFQNISLMVIMEYVEDGQYKDQIIQLMNKFQNQKITFEKYVNGFIDILEEDSSMLAENILRLMEIEVQFSDNPRWMDQRKQRAFYVDFDKKNTDVILTPQDEYEFVKEDVQLVINSHKWFIEYWREIDIELRKKKRLPKEFTQYRRMIRQFIKKLFLP